jgi:hypothetical protein
MLGCFLTVGTREQEFQLRIDEERHVCQGPQLQTEAIPMSALDIVDVSLVRDCGIVVTFSDGTVAKYAPEELADLRPHRELAAGREEISRT